jgi:predicted Zn-dependent protease with MMP-like domain
MTRERFQQLVLEALDTIPRRFRREIKNVAVIVEQEPPEYLLDEMGIEPPDTLFGLYQGTPLTERQWAHGNTEPDRITIYQGPVEDACETEDEIVMTVGETVIHEFGHYFGLSEEEIEEIEERYWRGDGDDAVEDDDIGEDDERR